MFAKVFCHSADVFSMSQQFALRVLAAFDEAGHLTDAEVAEAGGPSSTWMTRLRKAASGEVEIAEPRGDTLRRIELAAGWERGSAREVYRGGEPIPALDPESAREEARASGRLIGSPPRRPSVRYDYDYGFETFVERLYDRVRDLERRVDRLESTFREGGGEHDRSAANQMPESGPADQPDRVRLAPAADRRKGRSTGRRLRQEQDAAGEAGDELPPDD